jgi:hypothetical protein
MKKSIIHFVLCFVLPIFFLNTSAQTILSEKTYGNTSIDVGYDIKPLSDGGFIITGAKGTVTGSGFGLGDIYLIRTNSLGDTLWTKTHGSPYTEVANSITVLADGSFALTGFKSTNATVSGRNVYVMKLDNNGNKQWEKSYGGTATDEGNEIKQTTDGGFIITGLTESFGSGGRDAYLIKTNATGDTLWTRTYGGVEFDDSWDIELTADGGYILTGGSYTFASGNYDDAWLIKVDANGNKEWIKNYGITDKVDWAWALTPVSDGGFAFVGVKNTDEDGTGAYHSDLHFVKVDQSGNTLWDKSISADYRIEGTDIQETSDHGFVICGYKITTNGQAFCIIRTDGGGEVKWSKMLENPSTLSRANAITETLDGGYAAIGYRSKDFNAVSEDIYFVKIKDELLSSVDETFQSLKPTVEIYPNPATDMLYFTHANDIKSILLFNIEGRVILSFKGNELKESQVNISSLENGLYLVKIIKDNGVNEVKRLAISN